jgi:hypothetical protein
MIVECSVSQVTHVTVRRWVNTSLKYLFSYNLESLKALSEYCVLKEVFV